jgi:hypothetical protein
LFCVCKAVRIPFPPSYDLHGLKAGMATPNQQKKPPLFVTFPSICKVLEN